MSITWQLHPEAALGKDTRGDWHTASDYTRCECGADHRPDVEADFGIRFEDVALESWSTLEARFAAAHGTSSRSISPGAWKGLQDAAAYSLATYEAAMAKAARTWSLWPARAENVPSRFYASVALRSACQELGIREPTLTFHRNDGDGSRLYGQATMREHSISIRADLDPEMMTRAVRHECKHLALYLAGENQSEEACHRFADQAPGGS